jgi:hypothetical protein
VKGILKLLTAKTAKKFRKVREEESSPKKGERSETGRDQNLWQLRIPFHHRI